MAVLSAPGKINDGLSASTEYLDVSGIYVIPPGGVVLSGTAFCRNILAVQGENYLYPQYSLGDQLTTPDQANSGVYFGVYRGPDIPNPNLTSPMTVVVPCRKIGAAGVLTIATNAQISVGDFLGRSTSTGASSQKYTIAQALTLGLNVGQAMAQQINALSGPVAIVPGTQTIAPSNIWSMNTTTSVIVDPGANQESVTPTTVTQGVAASQTFTVAGTASAGTTFVVTIGGGTSGFPAYTVTYVSDGSDTTATIAAGKIAALMKAAGYVFGKTPTAYVSSITSPAAVITANALVQGTPANAIPVFASATGGTFTITAGGATFSGGVDPIFTALFVKAHQPNVPIIGQQTVFGARILPNPANGFVATKILVDLALNL